MSEYSIQVDLVCSPFLHELTARGGLLHGHRQSTSPLPGGGVREQERDLVGAALT